MVQRSSRSDWAGVLTSATAWTSSPPLLLLRRGDAIGAMLLVALMLGTLSLTLGHVVSATAYSSQQRTFAPLLLQRAISTPDQRDM